MFFTISWDDGSKWDLKVAKLLQEMNLKGTFYVPIKRGIHGLKDSDIKRLSRKFEIGSHTVTHPRLPFLSQKNLVFEITESKQILEKLTNKSIMSFAYPFGLYSKRSTDAVKKAGYRFARTTIERNFSSPKNPFLAGITLSITDMYASPLQTLQRIPHYGTLASLSALKKIIDNAKENDVIHIAGHSWEFASKESFSKLVAILEYVSKKRITPITNQEILKIKFSK